MDSGVSEAETIVDYVHVDFGKELIFYDSNGDYIDDITISEDTMDGPPTFNGKYFFSVFSVNSSLLPVEGGVICHEMDNGIAHTLAYGPLIDPDAIQLQANTGCSKLTIDESIRNTNTSGTVKSYQRVGYGQSITDFSWTVADNKSPGIQNSDQRVCKKNAQGTSQDEGCTAKNPICVDETNGSLLDENEYGGACSPCINTQDENVDSIPDRGCNSKAPRCVTHGLLTPQLNKGGQKCRPMKYTTQNCMNTAQGGKRDQDCPQKRPLCVFQDGTATAPQEWGDTCVKCMNTYADNSASVIDDGCSGEKPRCIMDNDTDPALETSGTKCSL